LREALRKRYWCDHCRKGGCSRYHMAIHERGCTLNPQRECGVCSALRLEPASLKLLVGFVTLKATWEPGPRKDKDRGFLGDEHVKTLREISAGCPVCMLAALRQAKCIASHEVFNMKAELRTLWADNHREQVA
jgi:hypothetical protein